MKSLKSIFSRKKQTAVKGRSSALLATILIHVVLIMVAGTFVAVEVIQRTETKFEGKQIVRPKMKLKKLQVPVKIEKQIKRQAPKLSQRVTANLRVNTKSVDFKMPEVAGFGGGVSISSAGFGGSLGFASTQLNVFGLRSSGEKILFLLDTSTGMLLDEIGGIPAYKIIKDELINLISHLPPTALFNVVVFDSSRSHAFSVELSAASKANVQKLKDWLSPLNSDKRRVGHATLPSGGTYLKFETMAPIYNQQAGWVTGLSYALQKGVDSIYWLGVSDGLSSMQKELWDDCNRGKPLRYANGWIPGSRDSGRDYESYGYEKWNKLVSSAYRKHSAENKKRLARGRPVRVIGGGDFAIVRAYFPTASFPAVIGKNPPAHGYTGADVLKYIDAMGKKYSTKDRRSTSIGFQQKELSVNVIQFVPVDRDPAALAILKEVARNRGGYKKIQGLKAIQSAATAVSE